MDDLLLLPAPRTLAWRDGDVAVPEVLGVAGADGALVATTLGPRGRPEDPERAEVRCVIAADAPGDEAYTLEIGATPPFVRIAARGVAGHRWALATLAQILARRGRRLPALRIDDAPATRKRGAMLDIARDRVPTMATLRELVATLASWKINHLQLYVEHSVAYRGHEDVWRAASPLTLDELTELDRWCSLNGVELCANQNTLGHVERWLRHPRYAHLGERACGQLLWDQWYADPNTLAASDPEALALVADLLDQLLPRCSGPYAHIGCDEPWDLGSGRSRAAVEREGFHAVYARHVAAVATLARARGKRPMYWADREHAKPEVAERLPGDIVPVIWGYEADTDFAARARPFRERGMEVWLAPSTNCWVSFTGRVHERRGNLACAARDAAAIGATGILTTAWGDCGHRQQWPLTVAGFADGAVAQWRGDARFADDALGLRAFGVPALGPWLSELGDVDLALRRSGSGVFVDSMVAFFDPARPGDAAAWDEAAQRYDALARVLPDAPAPLRDECALAVAVARWAARRGALRRGQPTIDARRALARELIEPLAEHRRLWLLRSRPGGLEDSCAWYKRLIVQH